MDQREGAFARGADSMKERPILFSTPMVKALLDGRKTQTRRTVKLFPQKHDGSDGHMFTDDAGKVWRMQCPYGQPGDRLWVRETWRPSQVEGMAWYAATCGDETHERWKPSIHMPRWASRITLEITRVRVERLQDISKADAIAEGARRFDDIPLDSLHTRYPMNAPRWSMGTPINTGQTLGTARLAFGNLWESINGPGSWDLNPWVWVIEFKRIDT